MIIIEKRLKDYLAKAQALANKVNENPNQFSLQERKRLAEKMLVQIQFFQHERLIHLIVTVTFAVLTIIVLMGIVIQFEISLLCLLILLFVLLVPYIRHYYILENGVQKLYEFYDVLESE